MDLRERLKQIVAGVFALVLLVGCSTSTATPAPTRNEYTAAPSNAPSVTVAPPSGQHADGLSQEQVATLNSLERVDDYPLYVMHYFGAYETVTASSELVERTGGWNLWKSPRTWACSLFAALADGGNRLYGRNFDWRYSPALLLFTTPPDGYASVSMVDIEYLGFEGARATTMTDLPLIERRALLEAPLLPFDGMNERGLAVGMAAVPAGQVQPDPNKATIGSLTVIREMLDHAQDVDEAVAILQSYNIDWSGGPPVHYLIADALGRAALVEFSQGEMVVIPNDAPWQHATNFLRAEAGASAAGQCWRYDQIHQRLTDTAGRISAHEAMELLADVSQQGTQWSVVYGMSTGDVSVAMGRGYEKVHAFQLELTGD